MPLLLWGQQLVENSFVVLNVPPDWEAESAPIINGKIELMYFMNRGDETYNFGLILGNDHVQDLDSTLQKHIEASAEDDILSHATIGKFYSTKFLDTPCRAFDYTSVIENADFAGVVYAFHYDGCTILVQGTYRKGFKSKLPEIWRAIEWKKHERQHYTTREELEKFCKEYNQNLQANPQIINDIVRMESVQLDENGADCLTYTYSFLTLKKADFNQGILNQLIVEGKKVVVAQLRSSQKLSNLEKKCMEESYIFKAVFQDMNGEEIFTVTIYPEDYR